MNKVEEIISEFKYFESNSVLTRTFTRGFCYDFACILKRNCPDGEIYFVKDINHYGNRAYSRTRNRTFG